MVKYLIGPSALIIYPEGSTESDYEGGLLENDQETPEVVVGREEKIRAVLIAGSFSTYVRLLTPSPQEHDGSSSWKSLFFYCCTHEISFAPLDSQGVDRLKYIRENIAAETPAPCSPRGIYLLAHLVRPPLLKHPVCGIFMQPLAGDCTPPPCFPREDCTPPLCFPRGGNKRSA